MELSGKIKDLSRLQTKRFTVIYKRFWGYEVYTFNTYIAPLTANAMSKGNRLTMFILLAMLLGAGVGLIIHYNSSPETIKSFSDKIKLLSTIFIRLVQMIIAPLVFTTPKATPLL